MCCNCEGEVRVVVPEVGGDVGTGVHGGGAGET